MTRRIPFRPSLSSPARTLSVLAGALTLTVAAGALAGPRGPEFPISIAEARDRMEARFKEIDSDGSGEISPAELAAAPRGDGLGAHGMFMHRRHGDGTGSGPMDGGRGPGAGAAGDADLFERLDSDGDGQLSEAEFDRDKMREARREAMQERMFARLDQDGSGGLSRAEMPDMTKRLEAMDADGDGTVTREEARAHRESRREAHRAARRADKD